MPKTTDINEEDTLTLDQQEQMLVRQLNENERAVFYDAAKQAQLRSDLRVVLMLKQC